MEEVMRELFYTTVKPMTDKERLTRVRELKEQLLEWKALDIGLPLCIASFHTRGDFSYDHQYYTKEASIDKKYLDHIVSLHMEMLQAEIDHLLGVG